MTNISGIEKHPKLKDDLLHVEQDISMRRYDSAAIDLRKSVEYIAGQYCVKLGLSDDISLAEMLKSLGTAGLFNNKKHPESGLNYDNKDLLYEIKRVGNAAAHGDELPTEKTVSALFQKLQAMLPAFLKLIPKQQNGEASIVEVKPPVSTPKPPVSKPKPPVSTPKPTVSTPKPTISTPKPTVSKPKPPVSKPKLPVHVPTASADDRKNRKKTKAVAKAATSEGKTLAEGLKELKKLKEQDRSEYWLTVITLILALAWFVPFIIAAPLALMGDGFLMEAYTYFIAILLTISLLLNLYGWFATAVSREAMDNKTVTMKQRRICWILTALLVIATVVAIKTKSDFSRFLWATLLYMLPMFDFLPEMYDTCYAEAPKLGKQLLISAIVGVVCAIPLIIL